MSNVVYFPKIYDDELVYSVLSRMCEHCGYFSYSRACKDFFAKRKSVDFEFYNPMQNELVDAFARTMSIQELVLNHTMFNWYARFLPLERRKEALDALVKMQDDYKKPLGYLNNQTKRVLKYCPCCVKEDREKYDECYWHRKHQLEGIEVCVKHQCKLIHSKIVIGGEQVYSFRSCEQEVEEMRVQIVEDEKELELARLSVEVLTRPINFEKEVSINSKIENALFGTKYMSSRTKIKYGEMLSKDYNEFWNGYNVPRLEGWQVPKICNGSIWRSSLIVAFAHFVGIGECELCDDAHLVNCQNQKSFDEEVRERKEKGESIESIAKAMNISACSVGYILSRKNQLEGIELEDEKILPLVKEIIAKQRGDNHDRPHKITKFGVCRELGIYTYKLDELPKCLEAIKNEEETYEQYWVRCVYWTYNKMKKENENFSWRRFRKYTNIRKHQLIKVIPFLKGECKDIIEKMIAI